MTGQGKRYPDSHFDPKQLEIGVKVEREHTTSDKVAKNIAKDHLIEHPKYYTFLMHMESEMRKDLLRKGRKVRR